MVSKLSIATFCSPLPLRHLQLIENNSFRTGHRLICNCSLEEKPVTAISWNVNSIRALQRNNPLALEKLVSENSASVLCLQETKLQKSHEPLFKELLPGWDTAIFNSSTGRLGYSGTATWTKNSIETVLTDFPIVEGRDEGRVVTLEFPGVWLINVYTMNSGTGLKRLSNRLLWDSGFRKMVRQLQDFGKPVIVMGDLNVARHDIDVHDPITVKGNPGFTNEERESFEDLLETCGLVDAFRVFHPEETDKFTFWDYRTKARTRNRGWRIDYALVSENMIKAVRDVRILDHVHGSDHCPVLLELEPGLL